MSRKRVILYVLAVLALVAFSSQVVMAAERVVRVTIVGCG
jgi:hypothetical protein